MTVAATIQADLDATPLGTRSRLADEIRGEPVLRRTVARISQAHHVAKVYVLCPEDQVGRVQAILDGTDAIVQAFTAPPAPWAPLVQTSRKWSLDAWRGGLGGTTCFDEYTDARLLRGFAESANVETIISIAPAAAMIDPGLADRMVEHHRSTADDTHMTFTQAPPGVAGIVLDTVLLDELAEKEIPIGWAFSYKPDTPQKDLIFHECCCEIPTDLRYSSGRLVADTDRATQRVRDLVDANPQADAAAIGGWLIKRNATFVDTLPRELEIELTTDDPYPNSMMRPRGRRVASRGPIATETVEYAIAELLEFDDSLLVLGGFGDPMRHPQFADILQLARPYDGSREGVFGLAVRTCGAVLDDAKAAAIVSAGVDVYNVTLDAWSPELHARLHEPGPDAGLMDVIATIDRMAERSRAGMSVRPLILAEMTKSRDNVHEMDDFYDGWLKKAGAASISGFSHHAGQLEDRSVIQMAPVPRATCRRLRSRLLVLADGQVVACDQDVNAHHALGQLPGDSLAAIWQGAALSKLRTAHDSNNFNPTPLCAACDDWHRP